MKLEKKRIELELMRVKTARMDLEFKIEERLEDIERMQGHIKVQENKELELSDKLKELNNK